MAEIFAGQAVPRFALWGAAGLVALSVVAAGAGRLASGPQAPTSQPVQAVELRFADLATGGVGVFAMPGNTLIERLEPGQQGFVRGVMRGFARQRKLAGIGPDTPFRLTRYSDGSLVLSDALTGRLVELNSFGPTNAASFNRFLAFQESRS